MKRGFVTKLIALVVSLIVLLQCNIAFAFDSEYMDFEKWKDNPNVSAFAINESTIYGTCVGDFMYYVDNDSNRIYTCFSINESNIYSNDDVAIEFIVDAEGENYRFSVGEDGINQSLNGAENLFRVRTNFKTKSSNKGVYIVGVEIKNGAKNNNISLILHTAGIYSIPAMKNISVIVPQKTTSKRAIKTTTKKSSKTTKEKTTKPTKYYDPNISVSPSHSKKVYDYDVTAAQTEQYIETTGEIVEYSPKPVYSSHSKTLIAVSVSLCVVAILIAIVSIIIYNLKKKDD